MNADADERRARLLLSAASEPNDVRLYVAVDEQGACQVLDAVRRGCSRLPGEPQYAARVAVLDVGAIEDRAAALGARYLVPGDLEWPSQLGDLRRPGEDGQRPSAPPLGLWVRGALNLRTTVLRSAAVVGSRAATAYGLRVASELGAGLADRGWATVSGGAFGVDAAAHRGSVAAGGGTVAVLACGVDQVYPRANTALLGRVAEEGLVVSELPLGAEPTKARFLDRNRVIAGLAPGTVLVEAAFRSGALNTAGWAKRFGRRLLGVPGPVTSPLSGGVHRELRAGFAALACDAADVVSALGTLGDVLSGAPADVEGEAALRSAHVRPGDELDETAKRVLDALSRSRWRPADDLAWRAALAPRQVAAALPELLRAGLVEYHEGRWRVTSGPPGGTSTTRAGA